MEKACAQRTKSSLKELSLVAAQLGKQRSPGRFSRSGAMMRCAQRALMYLSSSLLNDVENVVPADEQHRKADDDSRKKKCGHVASYSVRLS
jgi:hypothetical protein